MSEVMEMMGIERRLSKPYHTQSNGIVERFNGTLKNMFHKLTTDKPLTWDKLISAVLFAFREIPNTATGYPPFTLMYGKQVRGPADIIADICSGTDNIVEEYTSSMIMQTDNTRTSPKLVRSRQKTQKLN
ncbi:hypothetical protein RRG08_023944 [Elysia crispata]|uniref:Integrase catalytic domain-containing protein n=1 Tax=Elysia crispata TaxID=231223 RepID=A0AAE1D158_9GAST|nr:hypothetical protein RRG08_023944 [Elysia crispata]